MIACPCRNESCRDGNRIEQHLSAEGSAREIGPVRIGQQEIANRGADRQVEQDHFLQESVGRFIRLNIGFLFSETRYAN